MVAIIGAAGESVSTGGGDAAPAPAEPAAEAAPVAVAAAAAPVAASAASGAGLQGLTVSELAARGMTSAADLRRVRSTPVVRKIAAEHGIDISLVAGSGLDGRVTKKDILAFIEAGGAAAPAAAPAVSVATGAGVQVGIQ